MLGLLATAHIILSLAGDVIALVRKTVEAFEGPGHGPKIKEAVLEIVEFSLDKLDVEGFAKDALMGIASSAIDGIVFVLNLCGVFKHTEEVE